MVIAMTMWAAADAGAATTFLRPNADRSTADWTITGAFSAWDALDDAVSPSQTPTSEDYVNHTVKLSNKVLAVDLGTTSLAGLSNLSATAWFYTPDSSSLKFSVIDGVWGGVITSVESKSPGWHSIAVPYKWTQTNIDRLYLTFSRGWDGVPPRRIYAAFIQLTYDSPASSIYWGSWIDGDVYTKAGEAPWPDAPWDTEAKPTWSEFQQSTGNKPASILHFGQPAPWNQNLAPELFERINKRGAIPLMDMDPDGVTLSSLALGDQDAAFKKWAVDVREYGKPFFFRWSWEMNSQWFKPYGPEAAASPELYKQVWKRIHKITTDEGADNITWVWCPNTSFKGSTSLSQLYPGDSYVDWTCIDGYNRGSNPINPEGWKSFSTVFSQTYNEIIAIAPTKPVMIGEVSSTEISSFSSTKGEWIAEGLGKELPSLFPKVEAVVWFNWNHPEEGGARWDWQIESSPAAQASFSNVISSPYYAGNYFGNLPPLTKVQPLP